MTEHQILATRLARLKIRVAHHFCTPYSKGTSANVSN
jgi:hypothetical protein